MRLSIYIKKKRATEKKSNNRNKKKTAPWTTRRRGGRREETRAISGAFLTSLCAPHRHSSRLRQSTPSLRQKPAKYAARGGNTHADITSPKLFPFCHLSLIRSEQIIIFLRSEEVAINFQLRLEISLVFFANAVSLRWAAWSRPRSCSPLRFISPPPPSQLKWNVKKCKFGFFLSTGTGTGH